MNTPVCDFLKINRKIKNRFYMPGHKGKYPDDITEIDGADVLYKPNGIILESEKIASRIFNSQATFYSVEGASLCIRASVYLVKEICLNHKKNPFILACRNAHSSFISACAISDVDVEWLYSENQSVLTCNVTPEQLNEALKRTKASAFYLTCPDYLGNMSNIGVFAEICHKNGALFIVDNAHGAYLKFLPASFHPLDYNADIVIDSAHKTLPCLTGTAYLHIGKNAPVFLKENANDALYLFASTSPSYLLIASLDYFNGQVEKFKKELFKTCNLVSILKEKLSVIGYSIVGNEPLKLTIFAKSYGYYGYEIAEYLKNKKIIAEFYDKDFITFMFSPSNTSKQLKSLYKALTALPKRHKITELSPCSTKLKKVLSIKDAIFSQNEEIPIEKAEGRIISQLTLSCPPAIPIAVSGEKLDKNAVKLLYYYGIKKIKVIKKI